MLFLELGQELSVLHNHEDVSDRVISVTLLPDGLAQVRLTVPGVEVGTQIIQDRYVVEREY